LWNVHEFSSRSELSMLNLGEADVNSDHDLPNFKRLTHCYFQGERLLMK